LQETKVFDHDLYQVVVSPPFNSGRLAECPLLAQSRHSSFSGFMSAIGGKEDILGGVDLCPLMTHSGHFGLLTKHLVWLITRPSTSFRVSQSD
jgi:hypothetical protein